MTLCQVCHSPAVERICRRCLVVRLFECVLAEPCDQRAADQPTAESLAAGDEARPYLPGHETLSRIGAGGMGVVWCVRDLHRPRSGLERALRQGRPRRRPRQALKGGAP